MRLRWKPLIIWEEFSGNIALGVKCGTPEIPSGSNSLQHQGSVCLSPSSCSAQPKVKCRMWPWERILHLDSAFHQSTKGKKKISKSIYFPKLFSTSSTSHHLHAPWGHPFGTMSSATFATVILKTAGRWPCPCCCCASQFPPSSLEPLRPCLPPTLSVGFALCCKQIISLDTSRITRPPS